jgi:glycosyltransferase involved in cell wall biosynthesis
VGVPVLSSSLDAVNDILDTYGVGTSVRTLDPEAIGQTIGQVLGDAQALAAMRQRALEASAGDLRWENEQGQLVGLYRSVLNLNLNAESLASVSPAAPARAASAVTGSHDMDD